MVASIYGGSVPSRNGVPFSAAFTSSSLPLNKASGQTHVVAGGVPDFDECTALKLLDAVDPLHGSSLSELVSAIPDHPHPLNLVMELVDQGLLAIDLDGPFGPDIQVMRRPALRP